MADAGAMKASDKVSQAPVNTAETIAKQHGVSSRTVIRDGKRAEAIEKLAETQPEQAQAVRDGVKRFNEVRAKERQVQSGGDVRGKTVVEKIPQPNRAAQSRDYLPRFRLQPNRSFDGSTPPYFPYGFPTL